jgi:PKHD-type hydroxylase
MSYNTAFYNWYLEKTTNETWAFVQFLFSLEETKKIIELGKNESYSSKMQPGLISENDLLNNEVRSCMLSNIKSNLDSNKWIFERITQAVNTINDQFFNFDLNEIETLQFTEYKESQNDFYEKHTDLMYQGVGTRKLSFSIQLSDPESYDGGNLILHFDNKGTNTMRGIGDIIFFPSYILHEVTPVTRGTRYSLVGWVKGPRFK